MPGLQFLNHALPFPNPPKKSGKACRRKRLRRPSPDQRATSLQRFPNSRHPQTPTTNHRRRRRRVSAEKLSPRQQTQRPSLRRRRAPAGKPCPQKAKDFSLRRRLSREAQKTAKRSTNFAPRRSRVLSLSNRSRRLLIPRFPFRETLRTGVSNNCKAPFAQATRRSTRTLPRFLQRPT